MAKKINVLRMKGKGLREFAEVFNEVNRDDGRGGDSGFRGGIDAEGNFSLSKKGNDSAARMNYESRITGRVYVEDGDTVIEYAVQQSMVFLVSYIVAAIATVALDVYALVSYFTADNIMPVLPASFLTLGFLIMTVIMTVKPDAKSLEKQLMRICEAYAE